MSICESLDSFSDASSGDRVNDGKRFPQVAQRQWPVAKSSHMRLLEKTRVPVHIGGVRLRNTSTTEKHQENQRNVLINRSKRRRGERVNGHLRNGGSCSPPFDKLTHVHMDRNGRRGAPARGAGPSPRKLGVEANAARGTGRPSLGRLELSPSKVLGSWGYADAVCKPSAGKIQTVCTPPAGKVPSKCPKVCPGISGERGIQRKHPKARLFDRDSKDVLSTPDGGILTPRPVNRELEGTAYRSPISVQGQPSSPPNRRRKCKGVVPMIGPQRGIVPMIKPVVRGVLDGPGRKAVAKRLKIDRNSPLALAGQNRIPDLSRRLPKEFASPGVIDITRILSSPSPELVRVLWSARSGTSLDIVDTASGDRVEEDFVPAGHSGVGSCSVKSISLGATDVGVPENSLDRSAELSDEDPTWLKGLGEPPRTRPSDVARHKTIEVDLSSSEESKEEEYESPRSGRVSRKSGSTTSTVRLPFNVYAKNKLTADSIRKGKQRYCCKNHCLKTTTARQIRLARECYLRQSSDSRNFTLQNLISEVVDDETGKVRWRYRIDNNIVCYSAFKHILCISNNRVSWMKKKIGKDPTAVRRWGRNRSTFADITIGWLGSFFARVVDHHPGKPIQYLPDNYTMLQVYNIFCKDTEMGLSGVTCSISNFRKLWNKKFPHVRIPAVNRFGSCSNCELFKARKEKDTTEEERMANELMLLEHRDQQEKEREKLGKHRKKCLDKPEKYLGLVIDGMDQHKTRIPHWPGIPKSVDEGCLIQMHLSGCLVFSGSIRAYAFLTYPNLHNDSNLVITIIQRIIAEWEGNLPPTLYLQLDNTCRENKNNLLFQFLHYLVFKRVFKKIKVNFLVVGHTHDQIDQMFSRISVKLAKVKAFTLDSLVAAISESYVPRPRSILLTEMFDFRRFAFVDAKIAVQKIHNLSYSHQFKIVWQENGIPIQWGKKFSTNLEWRPEKGIVALKSGFADLQVFQAKGMPLRKKGCPEPKINADEMELALSTIEKGIKCLFEYFSSDDKMWWDTFFDFQRSYNSNLLLSDLLPTTPFSFPCSLDRPGGGLEPAPPTVLTRADIAEEVFGPERDLYVGTYRNPNVIEEERRNMEGDLSDLEVLKYICVAAPVDDPEKRPFWIAKVLEITKKSNAGIPTELQVQWHTAGKASDFWSAKYVVEMIQPVGGTKKQKGKSRTLEWRAQLILEDNTVFAYNFDLQKSSKLFKRTLDRIRVRLSEFLENLQAA